MTTEERLTAIENELQHIRTERTMEASMAQLTNTRHTLQDLEIRRLQEKTLPQLAVAIKELEEAAIVTAHQQAQLAAQAKDRTEWLQAHDRAIAEIRENGRATDARIDKLVSAIGELLNRQ